ncbi:hypothetical protein FOCC_FOCC004912 [Frankliniella occidentalis]|nr:hypothetical protein FOCC_FOCC004912 [Frankliniella occidentalis]
MIRGFSRFTAWRRPGKFAGIRSESRPDLLVFFHIGACETQGRPARSTRTHYRQGGAYLTGAMRAYRRLNFHFVCMTQRRSSVSVSPTRFLHAALYAKPCITRHLCIKFPRSEQPSKRYIPASVLPVEYRVYSLGTYIHNWI